MRGRDSKYGAKRTVTADGISFASRLEACRWGELLLLQSAGVISGLRRQVRVKLSRAGIGYVPDFTYTENGVVVHEDTKGFATPEFSIKKRLWKAYGPGPLRIVKRVSGRLVMVEEVVPEPVLFDG